MAFVDETGHTFRARVGTTWAPKGRVPVLRRLSRRREVSSIVAVTVPPLDGRPAQLLARHFVEAVHAGEVLVALRYFRRRLGRSLLIVWDRLSAHNAHAVAAFVATHPTDYTLEWLPSYAPDLNPEELCNNAVKRELLNALPGSVEQWRTQVRGRFVRLGHRPDLLESFFRHAGLSVN